MLKHTEPEATPQPPITVTHTPTETPVVPGTAATPAALQDAVLQTFLQSKVQGQWRQTLRTTGVLFASAALIAALGYLVFRWHLDSFPAFVLSLIPIFFLVRIVRGTSRRTRQTETDIAEMVQAGGIKAVGPLLEMLSVTANPPNIVTLYRVLTALMPQMKVSDAHLLNASQRGILNSQLMVISEWLEAPQYREDFLLAALRALEQIGDKSSLPVVEQLTKMVTPTDSRQRIKEAALECLPALQQNLSHVEQNQTLLRASHQPAADPNLLLRPIESSAPTDPDQLLRPALPEDSS